MLYDPRKSTKSLMSEPFFKSYTPPTSLCPNPKRRSTYSCHFDDPPECFTAPTPIPIAHRMCLGDLDTLKLIGTGGSSKVYLVRDKATAGLLALKVIAKEGRSPASILNVVREQRIQRELSGEGSFLPLLASWHDESNFYLVTEYLAGGDMAFEMLRCRKFDGRRACFYAAEMVIALELLHKRNVIHRDVKPGNILFRTDGHIVLSDFGFSKVFDEDSQGSFVTDPSWISFDVEDDSGSGSFLKPPGDLTYLTNEVCGTPYYMAPEQHYGDDYSFNVDFWSMGVTLYRMVTNRMPFGVDASDINGMAKSISKDPLTFNAEDKVDPITQEFLQAILTKNPDERLNVKEIKAHAYFKGIVWDEVANRKRKASWKPFLSPAPKAPRADISIPQGREYNTTNDPFPQFTFYSEYQRDRYAEKKTVANRVPSDGVPFNIIQIFLNSLFPGKKGTDIRLRCLILPLQVARRSNCRSIHTQVLIHEMVEKVSTPDVYEEQAVGISGSPPEKISEGLMDYPRSWVRKLLAPKVGVRMNLLAQNGCASQKQM